MITTLYLLQHTFLMVQTTQDDTPIKGIQQYLITMKSFYKNFFTWFLKSLFQHWYLLLIGATLGGYFGYNKYKHTPVYFEGQASFTYNELHKKTFGEMADKLRNLALSHSYKTLGEQLKLSEEQAKNIIDIEALTISGGQLSQDLTAGKMPFYIRVKLANRDLAETLLSSLETYFNNNRQARSIIEHTTTQMRSRIKHLDGELQKLDSLKRAYQFYLMQQNSHTNPTVNTFNPIELYTQTEKLFNIKSDLEAAVDNFKAVKILDQFVMNDYPVTPSLSTLIVKFASIGLVFSALLSFVFALFKQE